MGSSIIINTINGAVRGHEIPDEGALFAGIPFAEPPVGPLRFRPPQPISAWSGIRDAVEYPPGPLQRAPAVDLGNLSSDANGTANSEDCLYLNIFTPATPGPHPVVVWLYGGGFEIGSASPPVTDVLRLAKGLDAVVVASNYRVGALGFLHLSDLGGPEWAGSTNLGLQDQIAALQWVSKNIAAFGGDPDNVTVGGQSAGAFSIGTLVTIPAAASTFRNAVMLSGSSGRTFSSEVATSIAADMLDALGLDDLEGLLTVSGEQILDVQMSVIDSDIGRRNLPGGRSWGVVVDGLLVPRDPLTAVANGAASNISLLVGATRDEIRMFQVMQKDGFAPSTQDVLLTEIASLGFNRPNEVLLAYRARRPDADLASLRTLFLTDAIYRRPATHLAHMHVASGGRAYSCLFSAEPLPGLGLGAFHGADLVYLFEGLASIGADDKKNLAIRNDMKQAWRNFIHTGDPGWPVYDSNAEGNAHQFGGSEKRTTEPPNDRVDALWKAKDEQKQSDSH